MSEPANFRPIKWETKMSDGTDVCSECGKTIPSGDEVQIRDGRWCSLIAYPNDPTKFCRPCVTPDTETAVVAAATGEQGKGKTQRLSKKERRQARRREKRAILAQMPYRDAGQWASAMLQIRKIKKSERFPNGAWQLSMGGYDFPANPDLAKVDAHFKDLHRFLRRKLRYYGAQEKRALCAVFGQRLKEGREILRPETIQDYAAAASKTGELGRELHDNATNRCTCKEPDFQHAICPVHDGAAAQSRQEVEGR